MRFLLIASLFSIGAMTVYLNIKYVKKNMMVVAEVPIHEQQLKTVQVQQQVILHMINTLSSAEVINREEVMGEVSESASRISAVQMQIINGVYSSVQVEAIIKVINLVLTHVLHMIVVVEGYEVQETIAPCGVKTGYYDVLVRTIDGKLLSYFEYDGIRTLKVMSTGKYTTTDEQACTFNVLPGGVINGATVIR